MVKGQQCHITKAIDEPSELDTFSLVASRTRLLLFTATGTLAKLPGNNPVQEGGVRATMFSDPNTPTFLSPIYAYTGSSPAAVGKPVNGASSTGVSTGTGGVLVSSSNTTQSSVLPPRPSSNTNTNSTPPVAPSPNSGTTKAVDTLTVPSYPSVSLNAPPSSTTLPHASDTSSHTSPVVNGPSPCPSPHVHVHAPNNLGPDPNLKPPVFPSTTLVLGTKNGINNNVLPEATGIPHPSYGDTSPVHTHTRPACKPRHKHRKDKRTEQQSYRDPRALHKKGRRFMKPHAWAS